MIIFALIVIWLLCGILAFRLYCRSHDMYEYEEKYSFNGFFPMLLAGGISLFMVIMILCSEHKLVPYKVKKKFYEFIVGKENKEKWLY